MKLYILYILICINIVSCANNKKRTSDCGSECQAGNTIIDNSQNRNRAIGDMPWNITQNGYSSASEKWIKEISDNGNAVFGGIPITNEGLNAEFDKDNHLVKVRMKFHTFVIGEQSDYTDEEKNEIRKVELNNNAKIEHVIRILNSTYGNPKEEEFNVDDTDMYHSNGNHQLAVWETDGTLASLIADNESHGNGCNFKLSIITEKK